MVLSQKNFTDIYDKYVDKIYRFVFLKVNSQTVAQDLTSETFTRTLEYINAKLTGPAAVSRSETTAGKSDPVKIENMQAFLYRTARNIVTDYYRQKSRTDVPLDYESAEIVSRQGSERDRPDWAALQGEQVSQIRIALAKVESENADVVMLHYVDDMSIGDIAKMLDRPEGTIRVMLHRGLKELRENL